MADIKKMKRWFKLNSHKTKTVQFERKRDNYHPAERQPPRSVTPSFPLESYIDHQPDLTVTPRSSGRVSRSSTPTFPLESNAIKDFYADMDSTGPQTPRSDLSQMVKNRTPNGSLESYYLETSEPRSGTGSTPRSRTGSPLRRPLKNEPRFTSENMDTNIRGRNHGYYIKAAGLNENEGNKENLKLIYDRSRMATPLNSNSASRYTSNYASRSGSFRANTGQRLYRPKKRPAPRPPGSNSMNHSRQHSLDSRSSNGEVAMKVFRKKKKAPTPPAINKTWIEKPTKTVEPVYPIEPPVDYDKDDKKAESSEEEDINMEEETEIPKLDLKDMDTEEVKEDEQPALEIVSFIPPPPPLPPPVLGTPSSARSNSPVPPPLPPKMEDIEVAPSEDQQKKVVNIPRIGSVLRRDIVKAAKERMDKRENDIENEIKPSQFKVSHQEFADELQKACQTRQTRINKSTLIVRHISSSKMYRANVSPTVTPRTPVDDLLDKAKAQALFLEAEEKAKQQLRQSAKIEPHEWIPDDDLDEVFGADFPTDNLVARGGTYYDITAQGEDNDNFGDASKVLYKKNKYAKPNRKSSNFDKLKKSIGKAFGSIKGLSKKVAEETNKRSFNPEEGWQIIYNEDCDPPPSGAVKIKRMEKQAAYAYNHKTGQLVYLPDFDRIIVTQDGRRIRETELNKGNKSAINKSLPSFGRKERPSLEGLFESTVSLHSQKADEERKQIEIMEQQFAQVRNISKTLQTSQETKVDTEGLYKKGKAWKSTPDLVTVPHELLDDGVLSDTDLPLRTSSIRDYDHENMKSSERISSSKRKKKSKSKKSSSTSDRSPRQKVLQKGMDYYLRSRPTTPNPVYSSDEEDEGYHRANSNTSDPTSSDGSSKPKSDSFGDSGIGQESLNSSASTASGTPIAARMQQSFNGIPMNGMPPGQMFFAPVPATGGNQMGAPVVLAPVMLSNSNGNPGENSGPFVYQTMYYPSTLPHGATMPAAFMTDNKYNTMPIPGTTVHNSKQGVPENLITNSDSNSTLVASNSELNSTLKSSENKSSSKVISVTPNIALVSYSNSNNEPTDNSVNSQQKEENDFHNQIRKQYVMGPVGYRPINFNPNIKQKPVSLPQPTNSGDSIKKEEVNNNNPEIKATESTNEESKVVGNVDNNNMAENTEDNNNNNEKSVDDSEKDMENNNVESNAHSKVTKPHENAKVDTTVENSVTGNRNVGDDEQKTSGEGDVKEMEENNNIASATGEIPAEIQDKYGHEDLIYL